MAKSFTVLLLLISLNGFSQSLTIEETVTYLNKLSAEHPGTWFYENSVDALLNSYDECKNEITYKITYDYKSKISIQEIKKRNNCKTSVRNITMNGSLFTFDVSDFDVNEIELRMDKFNNDIVLKGDIAKTEFDSSINKYSRFGVLTNYAYLSVSHKGYLKVFYNGIKYLISLAKTQVPKDEIEFIDDPFASKEGKSVTNSNTTHSNVTLTEQNGVTSLMVTVGGKITSKFILDSGAGDCNISSELEKKLLANGIIKKTDYLDNGLYKLADGSIVENRRINIPKLKVGNKTISNVTVSVGPSDSPNLLGQSFLKKLNKWSIDNSKKILTIE